MMFHVLSSLSERVPLQIYPGMSRAWYSQNRRFGVGNFPSPQRMGSRPNSLCPPLKVDCCSKDQRNMEPELDPLKTVYRVHIT